MTRTVATIDLQPGDRIELSPGGMARTVDTVTRHTEPGWTHLASVTYREGHTQEWSGGNIAALDHQWRVLSRVTDLTPQQAAIRDAARALLTVLDDTVPGTTIDYRVEQARRAATSLARMDEPLRGSPSPVVTHDEKARRNGAPA